MVVTRVELTGDSNVIVQGGDATAKARDALVEANGNKTVKSAPSELSRDQRIVCGRDVPVSVRMEVDVSQFPPQADAPATAKGAK